MGSTGSRVKISWPMLCTNLPDMTTPHPDRSINWFDHTNQSLVSQFPETTPYSEYLVERLAALLLERLPPDLSRKLIGLLPENTIQGHLNPLTASAISQEETSIGYNDFVERTESTLGCSDLSKQKLLEDSEEEMRNFAEQLANSFLWAVAQEFPAEIKTRMIERLPSDLRARMNLYSAQSDDSKVA